MHRRSLLFGPLFSVLSSYRSDAAEVSDGQVTAGRMQFGWHHREDRLFVALTAPAPGWAAVGFNGSEQLEGTRFVMGVADVYGGLRLEERIALSNGHRPVDQLGGRSEIAHAEGRIAGRNTHLTFSLPHETMEPFRISRTPGTKSYLMLAWSHHPDFTHHSAWRNHYLTTL